MRTPGHWIGTVLVSLIVAAGCSGSDESGRAASEKSEPLFHRPDNCGLPPPKWSPIPAPSSMAQGQPLVASLDAIAPGLASVPCQTIDNARNSCTSILGGSHRLGWATRTRFVGDGIEHLTADQAREIIRTIRREAWCVQ